MYIYLYMCKRKKFGEDKTNFHFRKMISENRLDLKNDDKATIRCSIFCIFFSNITLSLIGLTAEAILKAHKSPPHNLVVSTPPGYPALPQLPPQPYIPPPGSASIHYPQFQSKPGTVQYPNFAIPPPTTSQPPVFGTAPPSQATAVGKQTQQTPFLVPQASQAPPGSNPYPPQFVPPPPPATGTAVPITKFPAATPTPPPPPPPGTQVSYSPVPSGQPQKPFFNHPAPRS